jgi:hypothetical protein
LEDEMESRFEVIDAFMDGERVDAAALKRALSEDEGRDYLVDAWLLREGVHEDMALEPAAAPAPARTRVVRPWLIAAAVMLCLVGGYAAGYRTANLWSPAAPTAAGNQEAATSQPAVAVPQTAFPAPTPTRVIQIDFGSAPAVGGGN